MASDNLHYSDICRGRYLCAEHGGFCDGADDYVNHCPLCGPEGADKKIWTVNRADRLLHLVNGLQKRSARNASLISLIGGGFGALSLLLRFTEDAGATGLGAVSVYPVWIQLGLSFLVLSVGCYSLSMAQIQTTSNGRELEKMMGEWETFLTGELKKMEIWHAWAGRMFTLGVVGFFAALFLPFLALVDFFNTAEASFF